MRLLNTSNLSVTEDKTTRLPPYAILSHTWGEAEVLFDDILPENRERTRGMKGYQKLEQACKRARADGYDYNWIDTCCIDKSRSAELSETINSTYQYFRDADVCYVYLPDVRRNDPNFLTIFKKSRWFTRAWTLQELLAPFAVVFFAQDWEEIGTKSSLQKIVMEITGIPSQVLVHRGGEVSIAKRMSWAAKRGASRVEDIAYALMGIFGVNMPTMYGEGRNTFLRLQLKIMKSSDDQSIFAWTADPSVKERGLLAIAPDEFANCGNIDVLKGTPTTFSMTNRGLHIQLPLIHRTGDEFLALLNCCAEGESAQVAIIVKKVGDQAYQRIFPSKLEQINDFSSLGQQDLTYMYFKEKNRAPFDISERMRGHSLFTFIINRLPYAGFSLVKKFPEEFCTYQADGRLRVAIPSNGTPVALRFENSSNTQAFVIMIGVHNFGVWSDIIVDGEMEKESTEQVWVTFCSEHARAESLRKNKDRITKAFGDGMRTVSLAVRRTSSDRAGEIRHWVGIAIHGLDPSPSDAYGWTVATSDLFIAGYFLQDAFPPANWQSDLQDEMVLRLKVPCAAVLVFQHRITGETFAAVFGENDNKTWASVLTNYGKETAEVIRQSYLEGGSRVKARIEAETHDESISDGTTVRLKTRVCGVRSLATHVTINYSSSDSSAMAIASLEELCKDPQYSDRKNYFIKCRDEFLANADAQNDHKAYLRGDDSVEYTALPGLVPRKIVGDPAAGGGIPFRRSDSLFTDYALHNPKDNIVSSTEASLIFANKASPDVRQYAAEWDANGMDNSPVAGMSYFHFLVIPRKKVYNVVSLTDTSIIEEMLTHFKNFWSTSDAAQRSINRINASIDAREKDVLSNLSKIPTKTKEYQEVMKLVRIASDEFAARLRRLTFTDFVFGFHALPNVNIGHLHMHVLSAPVEMRNYSTDAHDWRIIPAKAVIDVIRRTTVRR